MIIGSKFYHIKSCSDSMKLAKEHMYTAPDGTVFVVDQLTHARGRQGREWQICAGQLALTILLKPAHDNRHPELVSGSKPNALVTPQALNHLNMALTLGILEPLKKYGVGLKWPNDFVVRDKKLGGMLLEAVWAGPAGQPELVGVILGFALNINNSFEPDNRLCGLAIGLCEITGEQTDLAQLQDQIVHTLDSWYQKWGSGDFETIYNLWKENQVYMGKKISVHNADGSVMNGIFVDLLSSGDLILKDDLGVDHTISFYTVSSWT